MVKECIVMKNNKNLAGSFSEYATDVTEENPEDGSWSGVLKRRDPETGEMCPFAVVHVRSDI